jgi:hypothetical protein
MARRLFIACVMHHAFSFISNRLFWDKKLRIAILTLATFIAMC